MIANTQCTILKRADKPPIGSQMETLIPTDAGIFLKGSLAVKSLDSDNELNDFSFILMATDVALSH